MSVYSQRRFDVRCDWGLRGLENLVPADVIVIVDVLSFSTSVEIAVSRGAAVLPYPADAENPETYARQRGAQLAEERSATPGALSLSPSSMTGIAAGTKLVLPSLNGSALSFRAADTQTQVFAGCLRNASAVAAAANDHGNSIAVIAAGERWSDGSLRPALEDLVGAGAIIRDLPGTRSPEAEAAVAAFEEAKPHLQQRLRACMSGVELIERGFEQDVELAAELNASETVPVLQHDAYTGIDAT